MKILITGANGYVGKGLMKYLPLEGDIIIPIGFGDNDETSSIYSLDLSDFTETNLYIKSVRPDIIIHLAGNKDVFRCESDKTFSIKINYETSKNIVEQCSSKNIRLIYISTDYVFNGNGVPFHELSHPKPATQYGKDKLATENLIKEALSDYAVVRSAGIFGLKNDFVETVLDNVRHKSIFYAYANLKNTPTFIKDFSSMLHKIISKGHIGTFHCAGSESISRYDFAIKVAENFQLEKDLIVPTTLDSDDVRPADLSMDCLWTYITLGYYPSNIETILKTHNNIWQSQSLLTND